MNLCFIGKYPPIEGGVSASTYWLAHGLAQRGHAIHVITNADEVEESCRLSLDPDDWSWYQPRFGVGRVDVHNVEPFSRRTLHYIPEANPFVSKIASLATEVIRAEGCDLVFSYYYEPYAVAGWLASRWTHRPLVVKHAGSDLDRLFRSPALATTYKEVLRSAEAVVTRPALMPRFLGMGVHRQQLECDIPFSVPTEFFHHQVEALDVARLAIQTSTDPGRMSQHFEPGIPTVGVYGKVGPAKGTFDLIAALGHLARQGVEFNLLAMIGAVQGRRLAPALRDAGIEERTHILPLLPNWKVPAFIRACTAVCFLERDFPVAIHGPIVPREILACGTCLILSAEIAAKQWYRGQLLSDHNVMIVEDPKNHTVLAQMLQAVLTDPSGARNIGEQGRRISASIEDFRGYVDGWDEIFGRRLARFSISSALPTCELDASVAQATSLDSLMPEFLALLRLKCPGLVEKFPGQLTDEDHPLSTAIRLCDFVAAHLGDAGADPEIPKLLSAAKYQKARIVCLLESSDEDMPGFPVADCLQGEAIVEDLVCDLRPVRGNSVRIEEFEHDVSPLFTQTEPSTGGSTNGSDPDLTVVRNERLLVLFHRSVNLICTELRVDDATRELIARCDGIRTTKELVDAMCQHFRVKESNQREQVSRRVISALDRLYRAGVVVFGEQKPGWGWTRGARPGLLIQERSDGTNKADPSVE